MRKRLLMAFFIFVLFFGFLTVMTLVAQKDAKAVKDSVLRFHIVANSDSDADQSNKFAVRDGIASLCASLFQNSESKAESMEIASENKNLIAEKAKQILKERNSNDAVDVVVRKRFFPTRKYDGVSLPAGVYDTVDVQIGNAEGKNFWCVMFPAICVGASVKSNKESMSEVLQGDSLDLVTKDTPSVKFKFKLIEIFENIKNKLS